MLRRQSSTSRGLAWYRPLTVAFPSREKPDLARLRSAPAWVLKPPGTCSKADLTRLKIDRIGTLRIDKEKLNRAFPALPSGTHAAVSGRSIDRELNVGAPVLEAFISEAALRKTAHGDTKLPDLIREASWTTSFLEQAHPNR